ncbi:MAG UNVERIFIED_CONTAM: hypothetical protein LVR18_45905 [Planctomycetaceae bacterium]
MRKDAGGRDIYVYMGHDGNQRQGAGCSACRSEHRRLYSHGWQLLL